MGASAAAKRRAEEVVKRLRAAYPGATCALKFESPLQLLIATILSAQCTDVRVNMVTPVLFKKYPTAGSLAKAPRADIERIIQSTGFFRNKAKSIQECCAKLIAEHGGQVPPALDELVKLPGVGRKTANVVLGTAFDIASGVVVDTHVGRLSRRLGLTSATDAVKVEQDLMAQLPKSDWIDFSHAMIHHGRAICIARRPKCEVCSLEPVCPRIGVENSTKPAGRGRDSFSGRQKKRPTQPTRVAARKRVPTPSRKPRP